MGDLEDLRKEETRLLNQQSVRNDMSARDVEKGKVKRRIFALKHPALVKVVNVGGTSLKGIGMMAKMGFNKARPYLEQGAKNFAGSASMGNPFESPYEQKRVVRVKKVKRKKRR